MKVSYGRKMLETWYKTVAVLGIGPNVSSVTKRHSPISSNGKAFNVVAWGQSGKATLDLTEQT